MGNCVIALLTWKITTLEVLYKNYKKNYLPSCVGSGRKVFSGALGSNIDLSCLYKISSGKLLSTTKYKYMYIEDIQGFFFYINTGFIFIKWYENKYFNIAIATNEI